MSSPFFKTFYASINYRFRITFFVFALMNFEVYSSKSKLAEGGVTVMKGFWIVVHSTYRTTEGLPTFQFCPARLQSRTKMSLAFQAFALPIYPSFSTPTACSLTYKNSFYLASPGWVRISF